MLLICRIELPTDERIATQRRFIVAMWPGTLAKIRLEQKIEIKGFLHLSLPTVGHGAA
jgi:hypothetical protein